MSYFITDKCTGCSVCDIKCPTDAIWGEKKKLYYIDPGLCIDCNTCAIWCPYDAIQDNHGTLITHLKAKEIPKAVVDEVECTGCSFCIDVCPFDCIHLRPAPGLPADADVSALPMSSTVAFVDEKKCVGCRLCEDVCIKECIIVGAREGEIRLSQWPLKESFAGKQATLSGTVETAGAAKH